MFGINNREKRARVMKSERLKKLEAELKDLEQWLKLGLVPKKDVPKHEAEIEAIRSKVDEERERLLFLKENDIDEYIAPKRAPARNAYQTEVPSVPDIEFGDGGNTEGFEGSSDSESDADSESDDDDDSDDDEEETDTEVEDEAESFFSEGRRWRSEGMIDPEADEW